MINYIEIAHNSKIPKDVVKLSIKRVVSELQELIKKGTSISFEIPALGIMYIRNKICAVSFYPHLKDDVRTVLKTPLQE